MMPITLILHITGRHPSPLLQSLTFLWRHIPCSEWLWNLVRRQFV